MISTDRPVSALSLQMSWQQIGTRPSANTMLILVYTWMISRNANVALRHYDDVIMTTMAAQITSLTVVYSTVNSDANQRKHQSSASLAFVQGIHRDRWIPCTKGQLRGKCSIWRRHHDRHWPNYAREVDSQWLAFLFNGFALSCPLYEVHRYFASHWFVLMF